MVHPLTDITEIDVPIERYLRDVGEVFHVFEHQDSGTTFYGVLVDGKSWFVKPSNDPIIIKSLRRSLHIHATVRHPALPNLHRAFQIPGGLALLYDWLPSEVLNDPRFTREQRHHEPMHPHVHFRSLYTNQIRAAIDTIFDVHRLVADHGIVRPISTMAASSTTSRTLGRTSATWTSTASGLSCLSTIEPTGPHGSWPRRNSNAARRSTRSPTC